MGSLVRPLPQCIANHINAPAGRGRNIAIRQTLVCKSLNSFDLLAMAQLMEMPETVVVARGLVCMTFSGSATCHDARPIAFSHWARRACRALQRALVYYW
jgi:hypothetical protein